MKILKQISDFLLIILCILSIFISVFYLIYHNFIKSDTMSVHYLSFQTPVDLGKNVENLTEEEIKEYEERTLFEINIYSNTNKNGCFLSELKLNYFMDQTLSIDTCRSFGVQSLYDFNIIIDLLNNYSINDFDKLINSIDEFNNNIFYYETYDKISWSGGNSLVDVSKSLSENVPFIISIDNVPYLIKLNGTYPVEEQQYILGFIPNGTRTIYKPYTFFDLYFYLYECARTNSGGFGDRYLLVDVSNFFKDIRCWNEETKQFDRVPSVDISKKYSYLKIHYYADGVASSKQSLFNSIAFNSSYGNDDIDESIDYSQARLVYHLTESDLLFRYSDKYKGYFAYLPTDLRVFFGNISRYSLRVVIDLNSDFLKENKYNLVGLDYSAFSDLDISEFSILSKNNSDFYILSECFKNTKLKKISCSKVLNLIVDDYAFDNEYGVEYV